MKVLLADDHALFRDGMRVLLEPMWSELSLLETASFDQTLKMLQAHSDFDLILLDLGMPDATYNDGIRSILSLAPTTPIVVISARQSSEVIHSVLSLGAKGYLPKSSDSKVMAHAIGLVLEGGMYLPPEAMATHITVSGVSTLTGRQKQVLSLLGEGLNNKDICRQLGISERTVKMHITALMAKFNARNRTQLAIKSISEAFETS